MPRLTVWMLRAALVYLAAGALAGSWLLAGLPVPGADRLALRSAHLALMQFGWLAQFVLGVAYWMLPRYATPPDRGPEWMGWTAFSMLQAGLVLSLAGAAATTVRLGRPGGLLVGAGLVAFLSLLWGRVKPFGAG